MSGVPDLNGGQFETINLAEALRRVKYNHNGSKEAALRTLALAESSLFSIVSSGKYDSEIRWDNPQVMWAHYAWIDLPTFTQETRLSRHHKRVYVPAQSLSAAVDRGIEWDNQGWDGFYDLLCSNIWQQEKRADLPRLLPAGKYTAVVNEFEKSLEALRTGRITGAVAS